MKKIVLILTILLSFALIFTLSGCEMVKSIINKISAADGDINPSEGLEYKLNDDGNSYSCIGIGTCTDTDIIIAKEYNGKPVTEISSSAFYGCSSLTSVTIPDSVKFIGSFFLDPSFLHTHTDIYCGPFRDCKSLTSITVDKNNTAYKSIDGNLYSKDGKTLIRYAMGKKESSFTVPDSVTLIGNNAFEDCTDLTNLTIGNGVTSIGDFAFNNCSSLTSINIPDSVTSIG